MKRLLLPLLLLSMLFCTAQDAHFSHIHASPLNNNPAWTGVFNDDFRVISGYRNQWKTPTSNFNTFTLSMDGKYTLPSAWMTVNGGFSFLTDQGGDLNYGVNNFNFLGGTTLALDRQRRNFLSLGVQFGIINHHMDITNLTSLDFEPLVYAVDLNKKVFDLSLGGGYYFSLGERKTIYAGLALYHINQPNVSIIEGGEVDLYKRWVANLGSNWEFKNGVGIQPSVILYWQGPHREVNAGGFVSFSLVENSYVQKSEIRLYVGLWTRYYINTEHRSGFDAMILSARCDVGKVIISTSVDLTISKLNGGSGFIGSPELSMIYSFSLNRKKKVFKKRKIYCPKF